MEEDYEKKNGKRKRKIEIFAVSRVSKRSKMHWDSHRDVESKPKTEILRTPKFGLKPHQLEHADRIDREILNESMWYLDTSLPGTGKTYIPIEIAKRRGLQLLVVCPKSVKSKWCKIAGQAGVKLADVLTYQMLMRRGGTDKKKPWIHRLEVPEGVDAEGKRVPKSVEFRPSAHWRRLVKFKGVLLVSDEVHKGKNASQQSRAVAALSSVFHGVEPKDCRSRIALISGTCMDKRPQMCNLMTLTSVTTHRCFAEWDRAQKRWIPLGYLQYEKWHNALVDRHAEGPTSAFQKVTAYRIRSDTGEEYYPNFVAAKGYCSSSMPAEYGRAPMDAKEGMYHMTEREDEIIRNAIAEVRRDIVAGHPFAHHTECAMAMEKAKLRTMACLAREFLEATPGSQVVLFAWFLDHIKWLAEALSEYGVVRFQGEMNDKQRDEARDRFQAADDSVRVIVVQPEAGSEGVDFDDQRGGKPRLMLISPSARCIPMFQALMRIYRAGTKSHAIARVIYSAARAKTERRMIKSLGDKSDVLMDMLADASESHLPVPFPGKLPRYTEPPEEWRKRRNDPWYRALRKPYSGGRDEEEEENDAEDSESDAFLYRDLLSLDPSAEEREKTPTGTPAWIDLTEESADEKPAERPSVRKEEADRGRYPPLLPETVPDRKRKLPESWQYFSDDEDSPEEDIRRPLKRQYFPTERQQQRREQEEAESVGDPSAEKTRPQTGAIPNNEDVFNFNEIWWE